MWVFLCDFFSGTTSRPPLRKVVPKHFFKLMRPVYLYAGFLQIEVLPFQLFLYVLVMKFSLTVYS